MESRIGPGGGWGGGPGGAGWGWGGGAGGGEAGRVGRRVGWYGPVADNVHTARKEACNGRLKNMLQSG